LICIQHVVAGDVELLEPSAIVKLPRTCNQNEAIQKGALRLSDASHKEILDEINLRDILNFEEDIAEDIDDDASADGRSNKVEESYEEEQEDDRNNKL
jgi:hypothetical protein